MQLLSFPKPTGASSSRNRHVRRLASYILGNLGVGLLVGSMEMAISCLSHVFFVEITFSLLFTVPSLPQGPWSAERPNPYVRRHPL